MPAGVVLPTGADATASNLGDDLVDKPVTVLLGDADSPEPFFPSFQRRVVFAVYIAVSHGVAPVDFITGVATEADLLRLRNDRTKAQQRTCCLHTAW